MPEGPQLTLRGVVLDSPDPPALADFYSRLLGWPVAEADPAWVKLRPPGDGPALSFQLEPAYTRPTWPARPDAQGMMAHLDIAVDDLAAAGARAIDAGAVLAEFQPQEDVRVYLDPDGHPFCLFLPGH
jgi:catechol 2,3-dioxygenase-like lactoylglutathione lyase family enzyme